MKTILLILSVLCGCQIGTPSQAQPVGPIGLTTVAVDNDTVDGSGLVSDPLRIQKIYTDGSFSGDGTPASPFTVNGAGAAQHIFGDCSDGDVTISSGTTNLTRDTLYNNLTIDGTGTLYTAGYRVFVCGTLTFDGTGRLMRNGNNGGQSATTAGGAGASGVAAGFLTAGAGGVNGGPANGSLPANGQSLATNTVRGCGTSATAAGANGGLCCAGGGGSGGGGTGSGVNAPGANLPAGNGDIHNFRLATEGGRYKASTIVQGGGASGGGGGRGDGGGLAGQGGGGGGGGAGYMIVSAHTTDVISCHADGCIQAMGGRGGDGGLNGNTGGGGGGPGALIVLVYSVGSAPSLNVTGGPGGTGHGTGTDGGNGGDGLTITYRIGR